MTPSKELQAWISRWCSDREMWNEEPFCNARNDRQDCPSPYCPALAEMPTNDFPTESVRQSIKHLAGSKELKDAMEEER